MVELTRTFNEVWKGLCGRSVELQTDFGTSFVAKGKFARKFFDYKGFDFSEKCWKWNIKRVLKMLLGILGLLF